MGLLGGLCSGAILAGLHATGAGGVGAGPGMMLGAFSGGVAAAIVSLLVSIPVHLIKKDLSTARRRWGAYIFGALVVAVIHVIDTLA